jgi:CRP/FNR family cyclic AMP-dependent transcriptional regulator
MINLESLHALPLFHNRLGSKELDLLAAYMEKETFKAGTIVFAQGDSAERLYLLTEGQMAIRYQPFDGGELLTVTEVGPGGVVGWSAALGRRKYTSFAEALTDCCALSIRGQDLRQICEAHPESGVVILEALAEVIAERLRNTHEHVIALLRRGVVGN